jgi:hypothetical protein
MRNFKTYASGYRDKQPTGGYRPAADENQNQNQTKQQQNLEI